MSKDPGPGKYQTIDTLGDKYYLSRSVYRGGAKFSEDERFIKIKDSPGPGKYTINT